MREQRPSCSQVMGGERRRRRPVELNAMLGRRMNTGTTVDALITGELNNKAGKKKAGVLFLSPSLAPISLL